MKIKNVFNNVFVFVLLVVVLALIFEYNKTSFLLPQSQHVWRQADCASFAMVYYESGMSFFEPKVYNVLMGNGNAVGEFPGLYYLVACLYKIFGPHEVIFRLFFALIFLLGLVSLFQMVRRVTKDLFFAYLIPLLLFTSPLINFYANNYLCDSPSLSMVFIGLNFIMRYRENQRIKDFWWSMLFFALAGLFKANSAIIFAALGGMFFIELAGWGTLNRNGRMFIHTKSNIAGFVIVLAVLASWYLWAIQYNEKYHVSFLGTHSWPGWPIWETSNEDLLSTINGYFFHTQHVFALITFALLVFLTGFVLANRSSLDSLFFGLFLLTLIGVALFVSLFFVGIRDNIYYIINLMVLPLLILTSTILIIKNKYPVVFSSIVFRFLITAFFIFNVVSAHSMLNVYYHEGKMHYRCNHSLYNPEFKQFIKDLGIKKTDKVISFPDNTPNVTLYLIGQPGWSGYNAFMDETSINNCIERGAKYLVISDLTLLGQEGLMNYTSNCVGNFENVYVYKLNEVGKNKRKEGTYGRLKTADNQYVYFDGGGDKDLYLTKDSVSQTKFFLINMSDENVAIRTEEKEYFSSNQHRDGRMTAATPWIANWETFKYVALSQKNTFALKAVNGKYVTVEKGERDFLGAKAVDIDNAAVFEIVK